MKLKIFSESKTPKSIDVSDKIFGVKPKMALISQAVQRQLANRRREIAHTKDRSEVSGGGRKPFRQKGTGRARAGSTRSPIWIGGGVTFGPRRERNFRKRLPQKMLQKAIFMALSEKAKNHKLIVVKEFKFPKIATREVQSFLEKLPIDEGKILVVLAKTDVKTELSAANLPYIKVIQAQNLNLIDLLKHDYLLVDQEAMAAIEKIFGGGK